VDLPVQQAIRQPIVTQASVSEPMRSVPATAAVQRARHPEFADFMARVRSFDGKVIPSGQDVHELASAGFFHVGEERLMTETKELLMMS